MASNEKLKLCVVLLNYRTPDLVIDCLLSLIPEVRELRARVVVVDNHSQDDSFAKITQWVSAENATDCVEVLDTGFNGGFAAGNNYGIRHLDAEFYLLLNSDTLLRESSLRHMLGAMVADSKVGIVSPRLEWPDATPQESCFRYHRPISQLISSANTGVILKLFANFEVARRVVDVDSDCEWTSFACVLVRREVFDEIGLLDESFFMYFEDAEFCYRAKRAGWVIRNHPQSRVVHLRGGSSPVKSNKAKRKRQARYFYESRSRYFHSIFGRFGLLSANVCWTLGWLAASFRAQVDKNFDNPACQKEWADIWINFTEPERPYIHPATYK